MSAALSTQQAQPESADRHRPLYTPGTDPGWDSLTREQQAIHVAWAAEYAARQGMGQVLSLLDRRPDLVTPAERATIYQAKTILEDIGRKVANVNLVPRG